MSARAPRRAAPRVETASPAELAARFEQVALVLQGGGALGAYQAGVYEALHEAGIRPDWFAGVSIGAINAAILAGNAPAHRVERLHAFWDLVVQPASPLAWPGALMRDTLGAWPGNGVATWTGALAAVDAIAHGQRGFFEARHTLPFLQPAGSAAATSFYDTAPLKATLERFVDFDRIGCGARLSVGAVNVRTGNVVYFDSSRMKLRAEHIMASGALPPAFPAVEIDGEAYWDGGIVSNTPLQHVLGEQPRRDTLALQVDLWSARGDVPATLPDVFERQKDIQYSSRTRLGTDMVERLQKLRVALAELVRRVHEDDLPPGLLDDVRPWMCDRVHTIVHLIYRAKPYEEQYKDYAFSPLSMRGHWDSGREDMQRTLAHPSYFAPPPRDVGVVTHDIHRLLREAAP